jgi:8-oxo-dGTP diphosphatase
MYSKQTNHTGKLNPHVSVDCVIFGFDFEELKVLLIERQSKSNNATDRNISLPGNLIFDDEDLDTSAKRVLSELTGLDQIYLEQFYTFGDPNRVKKSYDQEWLKSVRDEPTARVITVAYFSLVKLDSLKPQASSFAKNADWFPLSDIPELAFDHNQILQKATLALKHKLHTEPIGFELLSDRFTLIQLQKLYEVILNTSLDKRNFRRKILSKKVLIPLNEKQKGVPHKQAQLYSFDNNKYELMKKDFIGFDF